MLELACPGTAWPRLVDPASFGPPMVFYIECNEAEARRLVLGAGYASHQRNVRESLRILRVQHTGEMPGWRTAAQRLFTKLIDGHDECAIQFEVPVVFRLPTGRSYAAFGC
jgi:hypothetical protein